MRYVVLILLFGLLISWYHFQGDLAGKLAWIQFIRNISNKPLQKNLYTDNNRTYNNRYT